MNKRLLVINLISSFVAFVISFGINFVLTPFITENLGSESYAFVKLSNDFISYISLISIALNSMANRYISVSFMRGDIDEANSYYASVFFADLFLSLIVLVLGLVAICFLDKLINIPSEIVWEVKLVFFIVLINFIITMCLTVFNVSIFVKNKLYLGNIRTIESGVFRILFLFILFFFFKPHIYYVSISALIITLYTGLYNLYYTKRLTPELKIHKEFFSVSKIRRIVSSGIWNVVSQLSYILNEGLDLLVSNIFIGPAQMGLLALAKTLPNMVTQVYSNISSVFVPDFTNLYANNKLDELKVSVDFSIKILGLIVSIPIAGLIIYGKEFYSLWIPDENIKAIHTLSILTVLCLILSGSTVSIHNIFTITNKVKTNSLVTLFVGLVNIVLVLFFLNTTKFGVYAVAAVSSLTAIIRNLVFTFPYAAKCINLKLTSFYIPAFRGALCCIIICIVDIISKHIIPVDNWFSFFSSVFLGSSIGFAINILFVFNKKERYKIKNKIKMFFSYKCRGGC